jgi:hypothetical protein
MPRLPSLNLSPEMLRERAREVLRRHWVQPLPPEPLSPPSSDKVEELARASLDTLLTRQFRVGPLPPPEVYAQFLERLRRFVRQGKPIRVRIGYGPLKNQNAVSYSRADWAEFFALCHLVAWHNKVRRIYPPGLQIQIIFDDNTILRANRADTGLMRSYMASVADLTRALGFDRLFLPPLAQSGFAWMLHLGVYQRAAWRVRRWERDPANREQLERMDEFARRNLVLSAGLPPEEQQRRIREASHRFRVSWEAMDMLLVNGRGAPIFRMLLNALDFLGLTDTRGFLLALYLDGSQHHHPETTLHLTSLDKGQVTQPWQGEGVLLDNGRQKLEPFVLTAGRRPHHAAQTVEGIDLVPRPGFERIAVVWPTETVAPRPLDPVESADGLSSHDAVKMHESPGKDGE